MLNFDEADEEIEIQDLEEEQKQKYEENNWKKIIYQK